MRWLLSILLLQLVSPMNLSDPAATWTKCADTSEHSQSECTRMDTQLMMNSEASASNSQERTSNPEQQAIQNPPAPLNPPKQTYNFHKKKPKASNARPNQKGRQANGSVPSASRRGNVAINLEGIIDVSGNPNKLTRTRPLNKLTGVVLQVMVSQLGLGKTLW